jgi:hypothetical protein
MPTGERFSSWSDSDVQKQSGLDCPSLYRLVSRPPLPRLTPDPGGSTMCEGGWVYAGIGGVVIADDPGPGSRDLPRGRLRG